MSFKHKTFHCSLEDIILCQTSTSEVGTCCQIAAQSDATLPDRREMPSERVSDEEKSFQIRIIGFSNFKNFSKCELVALTLKDLSMETLSFGIVNKNDKEISTRKSATKEFKDLSTCIPDRLEGSKLPQYGYQSAVHETIAFSQFQTFFSHEICLLFDIISGHSPHALSSPEDYI